MSKRIHTDERLKELALKIHRRELYGSWNVPADLLTMVFPPLLFMTPEQVKEAQANEVQHLLGNPRETFGRSINGYPMFTSFIEVTKADAAVLGPLLTKLEEAEKKALE